MVLARGLEPRRVAPLVPKTSVSTNSTTRALPELLMQPVVNTNNFRLTFVKYQDGYAAEQPPRDSNRLPQFVTWRGHRIL